MSFTQRFYRNADDLKDIIDLNRRVIQAKQPNFSLMHEGDLIWGLLDFNIHQEIKDIGLWVDPSGLLAFTWPDGSLHFSCEVRPDRVDDESLASDIIRWMHRRGLEQGGAEKILSMTIVDSDTAGIHRFSRHGFKRFGVEQGQFAQGSVRMRRQLTAAIEKPRLSRGCRVRQVTDDETESRVEVHQDAWTHLQHLGIDATDSAFTSASYRRLMDRPGYRKSLDLVAENEEGQLTSSCLCWTDPLNRIGYFEPVGTHSAHRHKGFGKAVNLTGLHRLQALGMETAEIKTAAFNEPAIALYESCGFEILDREHNYGIVLQQFSL